MTLEKVWDEAQPPVLQTHFVEPLEEGEVETLWSLFIAIDTHWQLGYSVYLMRSRWLDMIESRRAGEPDYTAEYRNAAVVFKCLIEELGEDAAIKKFYSETKIQKLEEAVTRLAHAKFFVGNDFIRCFIACGGFRGFVPKGRNYTGFMGGSRFREWPPVRTGRSL